MRLQCERSAARAALLRQSRRVRGMTMRLASILIVALVLAYASDARAQQQQRCETVCTETGGSGAVGNGAVGRIRQQSCTTRCY
jgi:hypothetical protein